MFIVSALSSTYQLHEAAFIMTCICPHLPLPKRNKSYIPPKRGMGVSFPIAKRGNISAPYQHPILSSLNSLSPPLPFFWVLPLHFLKCWREKIGENDKWFSLKLRFFDGSFNSSFQRPGVGTDHLTDLLAALEDEESRHCADAEILSDIRNFVDVELDEVCR